MRGIHGVLAHLQPIARDAEANARNELDAWEIHEVVDREDGHALARAHKNEDDRAPDVRRIGALAHRVFEPVRLAGDLEHRSVDVEDASVVAAADAALL